MSYKRLLFTFDSVGMVTLLPGTGFQRELHLTLVTSELVVDLEEFSAEASPLEKQ